MSLLTLSSGSNSPTSECGTDNCNTSIESSTNLSTNLASNLSLNQGYFSIQGGAYPSSSSTLVASSTISSASSSEKSHHVVHGHIEPQSQSQGLQTTILHNLNVSPITTNNNNNNGSTWPMTLNARQGRDRQPSNASIGSSTSRYSDCNSSVDDHYHRSGGGGGTHGNSTGGGSPSDGKFNFLLYRSV